MTLNGEEAVSSAIDREATAITDIFCDVETSSVFTMPRGMVQPTCTKKQCLKVIDMCLLRSGSDSGSRSNAFGEDEPMSELVKSIASLGIIEPIVVIKTHNLIEIKTRPWHPESNGIVERFNGTVRRESDDNYGANYLKAEAAINSSCATTTRSGYMAHWVT